MPRPTQSAESIAAKQNDILDAAMQVLQSSGNISGVTLREVAKVLGWSYSAAYRYYSSKEALLTALRTRAFRWMQAELMAAADVSKPAIANLERLTHAYIRAGIQRPELYQLMFFEIDSGENGQSSAELQSAKVACLDVCTQVMVDARDKGELAGSIEPLTAAHVFWSCAHGIVSLQISNQLVMGRSAQQITHAALNIIINGVRNLEQSSHYFLHTSFSEQLAPHTVTTS